MNEQPVQDALDKADVIWVTGRMGSGRSVAAVYLAGKLKRKIPDELPAFEFEQKLERPSSKSIVPCLSDRFSMRLTKANDVVLKIAHLLTSTRLNVYRIEELEDKTLAARFIGFLTLDREAMEKDEAFKEAMRKYYEQRKAYMETIIADIEIERMEDKR